MEDDSGIRPCRRSTMSSKSRCKICYQRERRNDPTAKSSDIKKRCANPTNGCVICNVYVCSTCWPIHVEQVLEQRGIRTEESGASQAHQTVDPERSSSVVVESFLAINNMSWKSFLQTTWERKPHLFTYDAEIAPISSNPSVVPIANVSSGSFSATATLPTRSLIPPIYGGDGFWRETSMYVFPLRESIRQGWHILTTFMTANHDKGTDGTERDPKIQVTLFQKSAPLSPLEIEKLYGEDLYEAYLAGCSIVWNNCDLHSPYIASLCHDLEGKHEQIEEPVETESTRNQHAFDKVFATARLDPPEYSESDTSPKEQTTDRNIFIFQLAGRKYWKTYWRLPMDGNYESKEGGTSASFEDFLYPGDILYIPKGMCYKSQTQKPFVASTKATRMDGNNANDPTMSFDVTISTERSRERVSKVASSDQDETSATDDCSANQDTTKQQQKTKTKTSDINIESSSNNESNSDDQLARKRVLVIQKAKEGTSENSQLKNRKLNPEEDSKPQASIESLEDAKPKAKRFDIFVGPIIASQISFGTYIRTSTEPEQIFCQELLYHSDIHERRDARIRPKLRGVSKVIATMIRTMTTGNGSMRVCDLCELVKQAFGDKVEAYLICEVAILALIKREIESGNLAVHCL